VRGATRDANTLRKHRNAFARHCIACTKRSRDAISRFKEMPVPQLFLSSPRNAHRNDCEFKQMVTVAKNDVSRTLSREFWQQKYFRENLLFARSMLATANFFGIFREPIRKTDSGQRDIFPARVATLRERRRLEKWKTNRSNDARKRRRVGRCPSLTMFRCRV